jgi:hypothetical protein
LKEVNTLGTMQKLRVAKVKRNNEGQYKTLYKIFDEYGSFLYYQVGADGEISEFLEDFKDLGYFFYTYKFEPLKSEKIH